MSTNFPLYKAGQTELEVIEQSCKYSLCAIHYTPCGLDIAKDFIIEDLTADQCLSIAMRLVKAIGYTAPEGFKQRAQAAFEDAIEWATE